MFVVIDLSKVARSLLAGKLAPGLCPICGPTAFLKRGDWLRDDYLCLHCHSIPRQRALVKILRQVAPGWPSLTIFESSPSGPSSDFLATKCSAYMPSQYFPGVESGSTIDGVRSEDLRSLSLENSSIDIVITQDVLEHVVNPAAAFTEIQRVLRPGGLHVFTVPVFDRPATVLRVSDEGVQLMPEEFHGNPVGDGRALVIREWGADIVAFIDSTTGTLTRRYAPTSRLNGIAGAMHDVFVTPASTVNASEAGRE